VTAGGVLTKEINPVTMESKRIQGLYFCGESIDLQARTGGYNLQMAFTTGWIAGESAATSCGLRVEGASPSAGAVGYVDKKLFETVS